MLCKPTTQNARGLPDNPAPSMQVGVGHQQRRNSQSPDQSQSPTFRWRDDQTRNRTSLSPRSRLSFLLAATREFNACRRVLGAASHESLAPPLKLSLFD